MEKKTVKAVTRKQKYLAAIAGDGVAPNPITSDEKLLYNIAEKTNEGGDDKFIVTFTLTSESGGTMDHTNVEILDAYTAGKTIMFDIALGDISTQVQATIGAYFDGITYPSFNALGVNADHQLIHLYVDPRNSESDTFTMQVEDLGGGSDDSIFVVTVSGLYGNYTASASYSEVEDAWQSGKTIVIDDQEMVQKGFAVRGTHHGYGIDFQCEFYFIGGGGQNLNFNRCLTWIDENNDVHKATSKIVDFTTT